MHPCRTIPLTLLAALLTTGCDSNTPDLRQLLSFRDSISDAGPLIANRPELNATAAHRSYPNIRLQTHLAEALVSAQHLR